MLGRARLSVGDLLAYTSKMHPTSNRKVFLSLFSGGADSAVTVRLVETLAVD